MKKRSIKKLYKLFSTCLPFLFQLSHLREQRHDILEQAKGRIEQLETAIRNCEQFDSSLTECQAWCTHVQLILSCRAANDVSALDVPHEYKVILID